MRYDRSYTDGMKTAISLPKDLFDEAERLRKKLKVSRSALYAKALRDFLKDRADEEFAARMNAVMAQHPIEPDPLWLELGRQTLLRNEWPHEKR